jgi:hypothetical protein
MAWMLARAGHNHVSKHALYLSLSWPLRPGYWRQPEACGGHEAGRWSVGLARGSEQRRAAWQVQRTAARGAPGVCRSLRLSRAAVGLDADVRRDIPAAAVRCLIATYLPHRRCGQGVRPAHKCDDEMIYEIVCQIVGFDLVCDIGMKPGAWAAWPGAKHHPASAVGGSWAASPTPRWCPNTSSPRPGSVGPITQTRECGPF